MLYATPALDRSLKASLDELDRLRATLGREAANPSPWLRTLRRQAMVSSVTSSVSIEGTGADGGLAYEGPGDGRGHQLVGFCVKAHPAQAGRRLAQIAAAGERWTRLEALVEGRGWPERIVIALEQSLHDGTDRASSGQEAGVSTATASTDLRRLVDARLIMARGRGRVVRYHATETLKQHVEG